MQEMGLQLLDALQRLETAERRFQEGSRATVDPKTRTIAHGPGVNGFAAATKERRKA